MASSPPPGTDLGESGLDPESLEAGEMQGLQHYSEEYPCGERAGLTVLPGQAELG